MDTQSPHDPDRITIAPGETVDRAEFAEFLRKTREQRQITLDQISDETKIAPRHLAALERGDVRTWPGGMYRRAMMRAYAESIGLDKDYALEQFNRAFVQPPPAPEVPAAVKEPEPPQPPHAWEVETPRFEWPTVAIPRLPIPRVSLPGATVPRATMARIAASPAARKSIVAIAATIVVVTAAALMWPSSSRVGENAELVVAADAQQSLPPVVTASQTIGGPVAPPRSQVARAVQHATAPPPVATSGQTDAAIPAEPTVPRATEGQILVTSEPSGARVTINGVGWGSTPLTVRYLPLGSKRVRLTLQGYVSQERVVEIGATRPNANVNIALRAREDSSTDRH
jgi:transcriptional regulator with XRE-family HTH domain